ncbi:MAG: YciI-like protein [Candidatus Acidiferrales bacterium]
MPYFALTYDLVDDYLPRRATFRQEHLNLAAAAHERGEIVLAGAFADPPDRALLVFRSADRTVPESFARKDPYVLNGLVKCWEVRPWTVIIGGAE